MIIVKRMFIALLLLIQGTGVMAHNLKGMITSKTGEAIPYATVFVKELAMGSITNEDGKFELDLPSGTYNITFRSLGYSPKSESIVVGKAPMELRIQLEEQIVQLQEISVLGNGEDPAYGIMRKVIGLSYVHLNQVNSYKADVYIKGSVKFEKIPGLIRGQLRRNKIDVKEGDVLVNETVSDITFKAPDHYDEHIRSINTTFPDVVEFSVSDFLKASLYQDNIEILFSPLGKNSFSYYNYRYEGFEQEGKYTVNKIKVTPKRKSKQMFEGYIYIIDDLWCLQRANLTFETPFGDASLRITYGEVYPAVWLPVGHDFTFSGGMMGLKGNARFGASIKYNKLAVNEQVLAMIGLHPDQRNVNTPTPVVQSALAKKQQQHQSVSKKEVKIGQLLEKDKLNNRDMNRLTKLLASQDNDQKRDSSKSLEIKDAVKVNVDKGATSRDTNYWTEIRPIPLSLDELKSFRQRDSILTVRRNQHQDTTSLVAHKQNFGLLNPLFFGARRRLGDSTWRWSYDGLFTFKRINFNAVDGWKVAQEMTFRKEYKPGNSLSLTPYLAYAFNRKAFLATGSLEYRYAPMRRARFTLSGGRNTLDYNNETTQVSPFINSVASLFFKENYGRYFEKRFVDAKNTFDLVNGLVLTTGFNYSKNVSLQNSTEFSFFSNNEKYLQNLPTSPEVNSTSLMDQINTVASMHLEYTPRYRYRIRNGEKIMADSRFPTLYFDYKKGIKGLFSSVADFDYLGAGINWSRAFSPTSSIFTEINGGWFPNASQIHFSDFAHVQTQTSPILLREYRHAFYLPGYYFLSSSDRFVSSFVSYKSPYILLKYLPFLSNTLWREMVWMGYYSSPAIHNYTEVGYTLLEVLMSTNVGVFAGFDSGKITTVGINMSFRIAIN